MKKRFARWKGGKRIDDLVVEISEKEYLKRLRRGTLNRLTRSKGPAVEVNEDGSFKGHKKSARRKLTGRNYEELEVIAKARPKGRKFKEYTPEELQALNDKRNELCQNEKTVSIKDLIKATSL